MGKKLTYFFDNNKGNHTISAIFILTFLFIKTWKNRLFVAVLTIKNIFKQMLQVILWIYIIQLTAFYQREDEYSVLE